MSRCRRWINIYTTHTTLLGWDIRNSLTADATTMITARTLNSDEVICIPPNGIYRLLSLPGVSPLDAASRRSSASRCVSRESATRWGIGPGAYDIPGGGEAGRRALTLLDMLCEDSAVLRLLVQSQLRFSRPIRCFKTYTVLDVCTRLPKMSVEGRYSFVVVAGR